ncbi:GGDEF domain-containing protein [Paractinoplanes lichenicola]|uniref:GGDEF domain-containing protein n=1 Tax=Paractinoplanes lichenicola TaxID=2802976 RepID=A0ABS1VFS0_9ACTN|nr:GGDEF domain-containing protein [Actinoplanes lichenicola]MBL7253540.1 GGDEF domain-containing protein [Actinoplanes lichenicola]
MLLRCYTAVAGILVATYLVWPYDLRQWPFLAVTLGGVPAVVLALRRAPAGARTPWWLMLASVALYNIGNIVWIVIATTGGRVTGDGSVAELFFTGGGALLLGASIAVVRRQGRGDVGGVLDSMITAVALGGVLWSAVLLPAFTRQDVPVGRQMSTFVTVIVIAGTLGAMLRVSLVSPAGRTASIRLFTAGVALTLAGNVAGVLVTEANSIRPDWTNNIFLAAYALVGAAAVHPSVALVTLPGRAPNDDLTPGRLTFLGVMLALTPLIGGGRAVLGQPTDGVLIALSSAALVPLVMVRVARLAAQRRDAERALHRLATRDGLTGLANRGACLDRLTEALSEGPRDVAVLFCDLDGFKPVNDRLGHAAGDELLIAVADRLRTCVRDDDLVSRFGGDEFVLICRGADAVDVVAARIAELTARPFTASGEQVRIGVSVGAARARPADTTDDLINRADLAMYEAKKSKSVGALSLVRA